MRNFFDKTITFLITLFLILFFRAYLSFFGFGKLISFLKNLTRDILSKEKMGYVLKSISIISSIIPNISCLIRATVFKVIFSEVKGLEIIIGIRKDENKSFKSHAWISLNNKVILNDDLKIDLYKVIYTL